jgi:uncharacterized membrane protein
MGTNTGGSSSLFLQEEICAPIYSFKHSVTLARQGEVLPSRRIPIMTYLIGMGILAALALGFLLGRIWQMRQDLRRQQASGFKIPTAYLWQH